MNIRKIFQIAVVAMSLNTGVQAATTTYNTESAFLAAAGGVVAFESFENAAVASPTSVAFTGGTFSCSGSSYCPGFFGIWTLGADTGKKSVYFASPDSSTFTFDTAVRAFGIHIGGAGDVSPITLTASLSNGDSAIALNNFSGAFSVFGTNNQYFGVVSDSAFTSITFHSSNSGDGISFDSMSTIAAVPEPETYAMLLAGFGLMSLTRIRKQRI